MKKEFELITQIRENQSISREQFETLMTCEDAQVIDFLHQQAREVADGIYENKVYIRGLIEFTNYCKNDC
ncbi:MAG: [FeFe] hydrogenase H-cluster radical SAM maturase HydE, partial [Roseburia sp.]|nr:[FeFe] hydrogenase H-cluster radical SAM maturase HydE [Roseburia sp.]